MDASFMFACKTPGGLQPYLDRQAINQGALENWGLELFWLDDPVEVFFLHIQGSARLKLDDGTMARVSYAAKTGHPYTAIGKTLIDNGALDRGGVSMDSIKTWLANNPEKMGEVMETNASYIFFQEVSHPDPEAGPVAAAGVPLTPGRSLAVDHRIHTFGTPVFVKTKMPRSRDTRPHCRLMIAQDTGSAIVGPARGDIFVGSGENAGKIAGAIADNACFTLLVPRSKTARPGS